MCSQIFSNTGPDYPWYWASKKQMRACVAAPKHLRERFSDLVELVWKTVCFADAAWPHIRMLQNTKATGRAMSFLACLGNKMMVGRWEQCPLALCRVQKMHGRWTFPQWQVRQSHQWRTAQRQLVGVDKLSALRVRPKGRSPFRCQYCAAQAASASARWSPLAEIFNTVWSIVCRFVHSRSIAWKRKSTTSLC